MQSSLLKFCLGQLSGLLLLSLPVVAAEPGAPLIVPQSDTALHRWMQKPVLESRLIDDMESPQFWSHAGQGQMSFTKDRSKQGAQSLRLVSPTKTTQPNPIAGRPFGTASVRRPFAGENWQAFNRLSFWVYPTAPGFKTISLLATLHNEGQEPVPDPYGREGLHFFLLQPNQWNQVVWEIPHLSRDKVSALEFTYRLQGHEPAATNTVCFDLDQLELQRVEADSFEGWSVAPGKIAYSHSGYTLGSTKTALASGLSAGQFKLINAITKKVLLTGEITDVRLGGSTNLVFRHGSGAGPARLQRLDFSQVREEGLFYLQAGDVVTAPFPIGSDVWEPSIWKVLNFFQCQRCGTAVPGVHDACHADWTASHGGETIVINGGWHDAGDLSQGLVNTAETTYALYELAEQSMKYHPALAARLLAEARVGLDWVLKTRFADGHRVSWATLDFWTDGLLGNSDDVQGEVGQHPGDYLAAAVTEALAARLIGTNDAVLAAKSLKMARADWQSAQVQTNSVENLSAAVLAAVELYRSTGEQEFATRAIELGEGILKSQQRERMPWKIPLSGFFHTGPGRERILHYSHRGHDQAPMLALAALFSEFPQHANAMKWYSAIVLHSEYLRRIAASTEPWGILPASIYSLDESTDPAYRQQVQQGLPLDERHFLRAFPVWFDLRGHYGVLLSQAKALSAAAQVRLHPDLLDLAERQIEWVVGRNPFAQSTLYGEGKNYAPHYSALSGNTVGSLPVGIQTRGHRDVPYWSAANCYNAKEVWVHPSSRWLWIQADLNFPARVSGQTAANSGFEVEFLEARTSQRFMVKPNRQTGTFSTHLPQGFYTVKHEGRRRSVVLLRGINYELNLTGGIEVQVLSATTRDNQVTIKVEVIGGGEHQLVLRASNLALSNPSQTVQLQEGSWSKTLTWTGRVENPREPWVALLIPDGNLPDRREIFDPTQ